MESIYGVVSGRRRARGEGGDGAAAKEGWKVEGGLPVRSPMIEVWRKAAELLRFGLLGWGGSIASLN